MKNIPLKLIFVLPLLVGSASCLSINKIVRKFGYRPVKPPSLLFEPGAIVKIKHGVGALQLETICAAAGAVPGLTVRKSPGASVEATQKFSTLNKIDADYIKLINVQIGADVVRDVSTKWTNVELLETDRESIKKALPNRTEDCKKSVAEAMKAGEKLTMIAGVIKADVDYSVSLKVGVPVTVQIADKIVKGLGLDGDHTNDLTANSTIKGTGIYWGMREIGNKQTAELDPDRRSVPKVRLAPEDQALYDELMASQLPPDALSQ
jgi:hypothetical protein